MKASRRLRIFLASPGDVGEERSIAREILSQLPYDALIDWRIALQIVAWDQPGAGPPMLATMTPQAAIDAGLPRPSACDVVVVILWSRMGTPLPDDVRKQDGTRYRSGTEWEYLDALEATRRTDRPTLLVYRRVPMRPLDEADPHYAEQLAQRQQVEDFFADFNNPDGSIRSGVNTYADPTEFRGLFEQHVRSIVARELVSMSAEAASAEDNAAAEVSRDAADERHETSTTTAAFVGSTRRGPTHPQLVTSWAEFVRIFGEGLPSEVSYLAHAVRGFFKNGGARCFVVRVVSDDAATAMVRLTSAEGDGAGLWPDGPIEFEATSHGSWGNRLGVRVRSGTRRGLRLTVVQQRADSDGPDDATGQADEVNLGAEGEPRNDLVSELEDWDNLGLDPAGPNFVAGVVNDGPRRSSWLRCTALPARFVPAPGGQVAWLVGGADGSPPGTEDVCGESTRTGLSSTEPLEDVALLCLPDHVHERLSPEVRRTIALEAVAQCERSLQRLALLSVERGQGAPITMQPEWDSASAAQFAPWVCVDEFGNDGTVWVPAVGHVAGVLARTDFERGVHQSPAGAPVLGLARDAHGNSVEFALDPGEVDTFTRLGISALGVEPDGRAKGGDIPVRLLTAVTTSSDQNLQSLVAQRFVRFVAASIELGTRWTVLEANNEALWSKLTEDVSAFLESLWSSGALRGRTPDEAFFVRCDASTMTPEDIDNGRVPILVGFAPAITPEVSTPLTITVRAAPRSVPEP